MKKINWQERWQEYFRSTDSGNSAREDNLAFWDDFAPRFRKKIPEGQTDTYIEQFYELSGFLPGESIFDMGCASGTLAIPFAKKGHEIYAADFSGRMLEHLMIGAREEGVEHMIHPILLDWNEDWTLRDLPACDVAICSRAFLAGDLDDAIQKLSSVASRKVCLGLWNDPLAECGSPGAGMFVIVLNELIDRGLEPELRYIYSAKPHRHKGKTDSGSGDARDKEKLTTTAHVSWYTGKDNGRTTNNTAFKLLDVTMAGKDGATRETKKEVICDKSVLIQVNDGMSSELSATPVELPEMTAGWLCSRGLISGVDDIKELTIEDPDEQNIADIRIRVSVEKNNADSGETAGKKGMKFGVGEIFDLIGVCRAEGELRKRTGAAHSCVLIEMTGSGSTRFRIVHCSEDTGRHTAMDKAIGYGLINKVDINNCILLVSGRLSSSMIRKAAACGIAAVISTKHQTTAEAVAAAKENGLMLVGMNKDEELIIYESAGMI